MTETVIAIDAPYFYAGVVALDGKVVAVAPVLRKHIRLGWTGQQVADYCRQKNWRWHRTTVKAA